MGVRFVKQPDGKLAIFSEVVDDFTYYDLTVEGAVGVCLKEFRDRSEEEAMRRINRALEEQPEHRGYAHPNGLGRWEEALEAITLQHGIDHLKETLQEIGFADYPLSEEVVRAGSVHSSEALH